MLKSRIKLFLIAAAVVLVAVCGIQKAFAAASTFGTSEDDKTLGYPDGRKIARDKNGNLYAAFRKKYNSYYQIFVSKSTDGGATWTVPNAPISNVAGGYSQRVPAIAIDSKGTLHVVWYGQDTNYSGDNERQIKYSDSKDGGASWSAWRDITPVSGYSGSDLWQEHPVINIDGADNLYVVWEGHDAKHDSPQTKFIKSTDGGNVWTNWKNVAALSTNQSRPTVVVNSAGKIFVIAYGYWAATGKQNIIFSTSTDGGTTFSNWNAVSAAACDQRQPSAAIDSGDKIHLAWRQSESGKTVVKYSKFTSPGWSAATAVAATSGYYQFFPSIANANGAQYIVWTETTDASGYPSENPTSGRIVYAKRLKDSTKWTKTDVTSVGNYTWGSLRWSPSNLGGGTIDIVYSSGASSPFSLKYQSLGTWGQ